MSLPQQPSRRQFLKLAGVTATSSTTLARAATAFGAQETPKVAPSDRIRIALPRRRRYGPR